MWPAVMVQRLAPLLPDEFTAEPRVHLGSYFEIDVCAYEGNEPKNPWDSSKQESESVATATLTPPGPTFTADADLAEQYEYEVLVYDQSRGRRLVAAVEIVSPANKDRPENRRAFVTKCAALLQQGVCVSLVDLVTTRRFNLYSDLLHLLNRSDPAFTPEPASLYAATCRCRKIANTPKLETWAYPLAVGQRLPDLPIWLSAELYVALELEASYEDTCRVLRIH
jgi:hypothetical protein